MLGDCSEELSEDVFLALNKELMFHVIDVLLLAVSKELYLHFHWRVEVLTFIYLVQL